MLPAAEMPRTTKTAVRSTRYFRVMKNWNMLKAKQQSELIVMRKRKKRRVVSTYWHANE